MNTVKLNQGDPNEESLYLYPSSDVRWPNAASNIYDMYHHHESSEDDGTYRGSNCTLVDDVHYNPDDDTTYMYNDGLFGAVEIVEAMDLFELPNHTTETGTIKNVKVVSRTRNLYSAGSCDRVTPILEIYDNPRYKLHGDDAEPVTSYYNYHSYFQSYLTLVLRPSADGIVNDWTVSGAANNWQAVDEADPHDGDTTYVWTDTTGHSDWDMYDVPDHTTETGTIQQVTVYAVARKTVGGDTVKFRCGINASGGECRWIENLTTSYVTYSHTFKTYPTSGEAWTWDDVDNMQPTIEGYVVTGAGQIRVTQCYAVVFYEKDWTWDDVDRMRIGTVSRNDAGSNILLTTFRPNAAGTHTEFATAFGCNADWECVDEEVADGFTTSVVCAADDGTWDIDTYNIPNHTIETGTITNVAVFYTCRVFADIGIAQAKPVVRTGGRDFFGNENRLTTDWTQYSWDWAINPDTLVAWTWADIDALEIGLSMTSTWGGNFTYCTQVYMVVTYDEVISQDTRTTQNYAEVIHYPVRSCELITPSQIVFDHSQQVKMWNHWSGNRTVFSLKRNNKTVTLTGLLHREYGTVYDPQDELDTLLAMAKNGSTVTFTMSTCVPFNDHDFKIRSVGYKTISRNPDVYEYMIELEDEGMTT